MISEESTTPDLVERTRIIFDAVKRQDWEAVLFFFAPDAIWDASTEGAGTFEGTEEIRALWNEWTAPYEHWEMMLDEVLDLGNGIVFVVRHEVASPVGGVGELTRDGAFVYEWIDGTISRVTDLPDIALARAAAERLAEERV